VAEQVVLSLGSNLGDRLGHVQAALDDLAGAGLDVVAVSSVYETEPVGGPEQGPFLNVVVIARTSLTADELLSLTQQAEEAQGRERHRRWGPRTVDVDVVAYGDARSDDPRLTLPHPRAHERAFVLVPWLEADPAAVLPGRGPVAALAPAVDDRGVRRREDLGLLVRGAG
jgi:2-amino-4-hydroxy-6-hydroxymethyldihydropteridine diphosphokinase